MHTSCGPGYATPARQRVATGSIGHEQLTLGIQIMSTSATEVSTDFTIISAKLLDASFQLKLEKFVSEALEGDVFVAANGLWSPKSHD
jgi:hypothetical protein